MKTVTCAMFGCLVLMMGGSCLAADTTTNNSLKGEQVAELGMIKNNDHLQAWINSIKPAAGHIEPVHQETGYWNRSVRRENQGQMQQ